MTAALQTNEFVRDLQDSLIERIENICKILEHQPLSDEDVHTIRKELKRVRASLRLLRDALGDARYRRLNRAVRDAAKPLISVRDAKVLLQTLNKVVEHTGKKSSQIPIFNELRRSLRRELQISRTQLKVEDIAAILKILSVKRTLRGLFEIGIDRPGIEAAIKRAHKKASKAFKTVKCESSDENLHEWRKQVKYQCYQLELLQPLKRKRFKAVIRQAHKLGDCLGDDHDLGILHARITTQEKDVNTGKDTLLTPLKAMRHKLQKKARQLGKPLYSKKAKWKLTTNLAFSQ